MKRFLCFLLFMAVLAAACFGIVTWYQNQSRPAVQAEASSLCSEETDALAVFARQHALTLNDWPDCFLELYHTNPDARDYVLSYPLEHEKTHTVDLSGYENCETVPLLMQWDKRWGYDEYAGNWFGFSGCGPTCLSMAALYLTGNIAFTPPYVAQLSEENGWALDGNGSDWRLISEGGRKLGLDVVEITPEESRVADNLNAGNVITCIMGQGDFTTSGHFIVLTKYEDGYVTVNDPNSITRSEKKWEYAKISDQILNLWVLRK